MATAVRSICPHDAKYGDVKVSIQEKEGSLDIEVETLSLMILSVNSSNTAKYTSPLIDLYGDKTVNQLVGAGDTKEAHLVMEKIQRWNKRWAEKSPFSGYVVVEKKSRDFVGQIILKRVKDKDAEQTWNGKFVEGVVEIGYLSVGNHWGKKYCHQYTHAMVHHLIPQLIDSGYQIEGTRISSVMATASTDNGASNNVLRKFLCSTGQRPRYGSMREWYEHQYSHGL